MKRLGSLLLVVAGILACVLGLYISAANRDVVVLDLLFWPQVALRTGLLVVLAFIAGALCGLMAGLFAGQSGRRS
ncbi:MAG: DUF1049 domain-containing protein [Pseudomonadota bacterium]